MEMRSKAKPSCARLYQGVAVEGTEDILVVAGRWTMWESRSSDFQARFSARHFHGLRAFVGTQSGISTEHSMNDC